MEKRKTNRGLGILGVLFALLCALALALMLAGCAPKPEQKETEQELLIGMYHIDPALDGRNETHLKFEDEVTGSNFNVFISSVLPNGGAETLARFDELMQKAYDNGKKVWLYGESYIWQNVALRDDCYVRLNGLKEYLNGKPYYDAILGFSIDEPLHRGMTTDALFEGTRAFRRVFPEKRFWVNFTVPAINQNSAPGGLMTERMSAEKGKYITDVSYDQYGEFGENDIDTFNALVKMFPDKYIWAVPMTMSYRSRTTEDECLTHLNEYYKLVKSTPNGVGVMLYSAITFSAAEENLGNMGYSDLIADEETFKNFPHKGDPWAKYYSSFYDENGNPVNGGYQPWSRLQNRISELYAEIEAHNAEKFRKSATELVAEDNQKFEYNGLPQFPKVSPEYLALQYRFAAADSAEYSEEAPTEVGEYRVKVSFEGNRYREAAEIELTFRIAESSKTMILPEEITEIYSPEKNVISINRENLTYSVNGIDYLPYTAGEEIDVTPLIVKEGRNRAVYFKEGEKTPYAHTVKMYKQKLICGFEDTSVSVPGPDNYSHYSYSAEMKRSGSYSALFKQPESWPACEFSLTDLTKTDGKYDLRGADSLRFWIYAENTFTFRMNLLDKGWNWIETKELYTAEAGVWTEIVIDLSASAFNEMSGKPTEELLSDLMCFRFHADGPHATGVTQFFLDDLSCLALE